jgi:hypothetical protein
VAKLIATEIPLDWTEQAQLFGGIAASLFPH